MVPLGISTAGAVIVGQSIGAGEFQRATRSGWLTIALAAGFMTVVAFVLLIWPAFILGMFTSNTEVLKLAAQLLFAAALFQIFDGVQVTATGVLRGAGNTRTPMLVNLMAHWLLGLPVGYTLCFLLGLGVFGLWLGLSAGLIVVAALLLFVWSRTRVSVPSPQMRS
jgi:MATE family multidrug resistance protein